MPLTPEQRQWLEREHGFADWRGENAPEAAGRTTGEFGFKGDELPGWELVRSRRNEALDPPRLDTFWRPAKGGDTLLGVQVVERPSVAAARETLLERLGDVESAVVRRRPDLPIGDVVFGQELILLFARGRFVVTVRNAGPQVVDVTDAARTIDAVLTRALR